MIIKVLRNFFQKAGENFIFLQKNKIYLKKAIYHLQEKKSCAILIFIQTKSHKKTQRTGRVTSCIISFSESCRHRLKAAQESGNVKFHLGAVLLKQFISVGRNGRHRYMHNEMPVAFETGKWVVPRKTNCFSSLMLSWHRRRKAFFMRKTQGYERNDRR